MFGLVKASLVRKVPGGNILADSRSGKFMGRRGNHRIAQYAQKEYDLANRMATANAIAEGGFMTGAPRGALEEAAKDKMEK